MQSYMQSDKATKMQSHVHSDRVNEIQYNDMQNEMQFDMQFCRSDEICRAYKARPRDGTLGTNPSTSHKMSKKEIKDSTRYPRASTPSDIDLPSSGVQTESNSISQVFFYDKGENDILVLSSTVQGISDCSQLVYGNDDLVTDHVFHVDDVQASPPSGQPQIDILERTEKVASNADSVMKGKKIPVSGKKEKKKKGSTTTKVRRRNTSRNKSEEVRLRGHIKRPQHQVLGFMEDHAEFGSDWSEASECRGRYMSSVLESTVDGSIIKGARRVNNSRRMTSAQLTSCIDSAIQVGDVDEDPLNTLDDWGLKSEFHKYKCSCCEEISHHRADIECHIAGLGATHSDAVVVVLLGDKAQGRNCSLCNIRLQRKEYFKHIREKHKEVFPLRCGYCPFLGHDHNQMRHHIQKKHRTTKYEIIDTSQAGKDNAGSKLPASDIEAMSDEEETEEDSSNSQPMTCPLCGKSLKTLRNLKRHVMQHSRQKKQCNLCSFTTNFPTQIRSHYQRKHPTETPKWKKIVVARGGSDALVEDATPYLKMVSAKYGVRKPKIKKWMRQYRCPHCDYTCNFNSSYNRHLRVHKGLKPFKCGYCSFHGREAYVVNNHCSKVHKGKEIIVEKDKSFKAPYRYAKKKKKERFEWDELVDVVENEVNHLAAKPSSGTLQPDIKVEVQTEASSEVNVLKSKSNNRNRLKGKTSEASMYKCLVISTGKNINDCLESTGETIQVEVNTEKAGSERLSLTNSNNNLGKTETESVKSLCETPLPSIRWDEGEESLKQNINLLLDDNSTTNNLTRPHRKGRSFTENREIFIDEAISRVVPMKSHLIEGKNQSLQDEESLVCSSSSLNKSPSTIKVKTFRDSIASSLGCPTEDRSLLDESSLSNMQFPGDTIGALSTDDIISSCIVSDSTLDNLSDETVVIQLYANENYTPKAVTTYNSIEGLEDGCVFDQKSCKVSELDVNLPLKVTASEPVSIQSSDTTSNNTLPQNDIPGLKCYEFVKTVDNHDDRSTFKVEEPASVPPQGLENTLHSHITFLSDSLAHRLSNRISAPPGVMTRDLLGLDYSNSDYFSAEKVRMMMKKKKGGRVKCLECGVTTTCRAFYKHAKKHFNIKPFKCGYCTYRSIEKSKIRVHNAFCHPHKPCIILKLSPETAGVDNNASNLLSSKPVTSTPKHILETKNCASEGNELYTNLLKNTKSSELEIINNNLRKEDKTTSSSAAAGLTSKIAVFQCPICSKILKNHTPSIRRHLYSHYSYKPYKCGYCTFTAIGQTEIRAHHVTHGSINAPKIEQSGAPMPFGLTQYIDELLSQQRGNKRVHRKKEQGNNLTEVKITKNPTDIMWHEPEASREDLTSMYLSTEDPSQPGLVTDDQHELEALGVEACSLQQSLESVEFNAETTYAVQVLETDRQSSSSFSSDLPTQLDLNVGTNSSSDVTGDPVCVVYLFE